MSFTSSRPLPLKQRTSSLDTRRDYSSHTWRSVLVLIKLREYLVTVDNFSIWRRHLAWAIDDGKALREYMTQRYASNMVFMSLLLSTELGVLFNSAEVTTGVRTHLARGDHYTVSFWAGFMIIVSALLTLLSLISTFSAWAMVNAVNESNAHAVFRSSIGQYAAELPGRLIVCSVYSFLVSFLLFFFILLPVGIWSAALLCSAVILFIHVVSTLSAFGRVILHSGAISTEKIFDPEYAKGLVPYSLHNQLLNKARANLSQHLSIRGQYRKQTPIDRYFSEEELVDRLQNRASKGSRETGRGYQEYRRRADSLVRFADEELGESDAIFPPTPLSDESVTDNNNQCSSNSRSLTPLSDASSQETSSHKDKSSFDLKGRPPTPLATNSKALNHVKDSRRFVSPADGAIASDRRPSCPPKRPSLPTWSNPSMSTANAMPFSSSTSSLELWLQASPTISQQKGSTSSSMHNENRKAGSRDSLGSTISMSMPPPPPPLPPIVTTFRNTSVTSSVGDYQDESPNIKSILNGVLSDREEKRFFSDYGDIVDNDLPLEGSKEERNARVPTLQHPGSERDDKHAGQCRQNPEMTSLLEHGNQTNYSTTGDPTFMSSAPSTDAPRKRTSGDTTRPENSSI